MAVISATIRAIVCISNLSFCISVKIFRVLATTLTNDFCSVANLTSPFLWLEDIILQSSELTNGIDKGQLLVSKKFFSISFEVVWEIREVKLLQIMSAIFSCKGVGGEWRGGWAFHIDCQFFEPYQNSCTAYSVTPF